jgi:hypothetical protein
VMWPHRQIYGGRVYVVWPAYERTTSGRGSSTRIILSDFQ